MSGPGASSAREAAPAGLYLSPQQRRAEGTDEEVIDPQREIVDAHHHLYDRPGARYLLEEYLADYSLGHNLVASVYVEILAMARADGPEMLRPLGEVEFANGVAAMAASGRYGPTRVAAGIVGHADLRHGARVGELLDQCMAVAPARFRGIRQVALEFDDPSLGQYITNPPPRGLLQDPAVLAGLNELAHRGLTFDAVVFHHQLDALLHVVRAVPNLTFVLNHVGMPLLLTVPHSERPAQFASWRRGLRELAREPNVVCKVGGLGQVFFGFGFDQSTHVPSSEELAGAWKPFVYEAVDAFGAERCMLTSNFPVDARSCGLVPYWNALKRCLADASDGEKDALFSGTARRIYDLGI